MIFPECIETTTQWERGHADDHWTLVPLCLKCKAPESTYHEHNPEGRDYHAFVDPRDPLIRGENAWRTNDCPGFVYPDEKCDCRCHWGIYYVNAYEVARCYGGPEEGGWWYNSGEPVESVRFDSLRAAETYRDDTGSIKFPLTKKRYSVLDGEDYDLLIECYFAKPWPDERPRYE